MDYRIVNKIMCSLEGGYPQVNLKKRITLVCQRYVNLDAQGKNKPFIKEVICVCDYPPVPAELGIHH